MMTRAFILALVTLFAPTLQAKLKPASVVVNCSLGQTVAGALATDADVLTIGFVGTCTEDIVVQRGNLIIRGLDSTALIQGSLAFDHTVPGPDTSSDGPVTLENFSITSSAADGLTVGPGNRVVAHQVVITNSANNGISVYGGGFLRCIDCTSNDNGVSGLTVASSSAEIAGHSTFDGNGVYGILAGGSGEVALVDRSASPTNAVIQVNNNPDGIVISDGASLSDAPSTTIEASFNGPPKSSFGSGILIGTGGASILQGAIHSEGNNGAGIYALAGKILILGSVNADANTVGLFSQNNGTLRIAGSGQVTNNTLNGARVDGSFMQAGNTTFSDNATDVLLRFGAKASFTNSTPTTVVCDGTALTSGSVACP